MTAHNSSYLNSVDDEWYKSRLSTIIISVMVAFILLSFRLFHLQLIQGKKYQRLSNNNCIRLKTINAPRGLIFDRNGELIVDNRPSFDLGIVLSDAKPLEDTLIKLANYTKIDYETLKTKVAKGKRISKYKHLILKQDIGRDLLAVVETHKFDLPGVEIVVNPRRHYIHKQSASHLLGYLGEISAKELRDGKYSDAKSGDFIGKYGAEKAVESFLNGKSGGQQIEVNVMGQIVKVRKTVDAKPGFNIHLTLDINLQKKAEELLKDKVGAIIALDPNSGEVLAMASNPTFDQNAFVNGLSHKDWNKLITNPYRPMENKSIQGEYPPGSTYKIIVAAAGLEEKVIDINSKFNCPGFYQCGNRAFRCWKQGGHGTVNVVSALAESCDVFFYQVGQKLGVDRMAWYSKAFGLNVPTGINLDKEADGLIPTSAWKKKRTGVSWQGGETLSMAIGQGFNLATPIQMGVVVSSIANGGTIYKPIVVKTIRIPQGDVYQENTKKLIGRLPISINNIKIIQRGLWRAVNSVMGTANLSMINGIQMCGKTGTAQVFSYKSRDRIKEEEMPKHLRSHAWFIAYAPYKRPKIAIVVIIEHGGHGSTVASPLAKKLVKFYLTPKS